MILMYSVNMFYFIGGDFMKGLRFLSVLLILSAFLACEEGGSSSGGIEVAAYSLDDVADYSGGGTVPNDETKAGDTMEAIDYISAFYAYSAADAEVSSGKSRVVQSINETSDLAEDEIGTGTIFITGSITASDPEDPSSVTDLDMTYVYTDCVTDDYPEYTINGSDHIRSVTRMVYTMTEEDIVINMTAQVTQRTVYSVSGDLYACKILGSMNYSYSMSMGMSEIFSGGMPEINFGEISGSWQFYDNVGELVYEHTITQEDITVDLSGMEGGD